ncbi:MAG TPA: HlyD family secretion protein [Candidatus Acidoferrum sp.]|nr:HlyD family secretion protein [Candidatus Acidoferrum sp.]
MAPRTDVDAPSAPVETPANDHASETHAAAPPPPPRRKLLPTSPGGRLLLVIVAIAVIVGAFFAWRYFSSYESTDDAEVDGHLMPLSARISGYISKVNVDDNQVVKAGTVLAEIDPHDYQVAVDQAQANLATATATAQSLRITVPITHISTSSQVSAAQAGIENAKAAVAAAQSQYAADEAQLTRAEADNVKAQADLQRYSQLIAKKEISQQTYDAAVATAKASASAVTAAQASAAAAEQQVGQAKAGLAEAQANLQSAQTGPQQVSSARAKAQSALATVQQKQAALEQAQLNLGYTKIYAPVDGIVMKNAEVGMNVQPGQQLFTIVPLNDIWITANFKETQLHYMKPGERAEIKVDSNGQTYEGHVDSIAGATGARTSLLPPENATGNYVKVVQRIPVKIVLNAGEDKNHFLRLGMSCEPKVFVK